MKIGILIKIIKKYYGYNDDEDYETIDKFYELDNNEEEYTIKQKISNKYPRLSEINHGYDEIIYDLDTKQKYLIIIFDV